MSPLYGVEMPKRPQGALQKNTSNIKHTIK